MADPETLPEDVAALRALVLTAWTERDAERTEKTRLAEQNDRLRQLIRQLQRMQFGRHSERLDPDQFSLALEDLEQAVAAAEAEQEKAEPELRQSRAKQRRTSRGALPEHLPRVEVVIEPENRACPGCGGAMHVIGEDCSQRLDVIPAQYRVIVTRRPKYACRGCQGAIVQAPAPARLIEGGLPTEQLVAQVVVAKYADHCPLYRQSQILARQGIDHRSGDIGVLGRLCRGRAEAAMAAAARGATGLAQTVRRRDHRTSARPRTGPDQEGLLLGARPRRPTVAWRRAAGSGVQLCTGAQRRLRRSPAAGVHRHPANRRLCRLSRPCRSQAPRRSGDAGLLLGASMDRPSSARQNSASSAITVVCSHPFGLVLRQL